MDKRKGYVLLLINAVITLASKRAFRVLLLELIKLTATT